MEKKSIYLIIGLIVFIIIILMVILFSYNFFFKKNKGEIEINNTSKCLSGYSLINGICITEKTDFSCLGQIIPALTRERNDIICNYAIYNSSSILNYNNIVSNNKTIKATGKVWKEYPLTSNTVLQLIINSSNPYNYFDVQIMDIVQTHEQIVSVNGNFKITLKAKNPQYKQGSEVFYVYEIQNLDNNTLIIPKNGDSVLEIRDSAGRPPKTYHSSENLTIIKNDLTLLPMEKSSQEFSINGDDFGFVTTNIVDGSYYVATINIGMVKSNKAMVRIFK